jgi:uncharacterized protein
MLLMMNPISTIDVTVLAKAPVQPQERISSIDILRGFALLGILVSNMDDFSSVARYFPGLTLWPRAIDQWVEWGINFFVDGKFYVLFSFLFGLGFGIQMARFEQRGIKSVPLYSRRLIVLFFIGLFHGIFVWWGDVLAVYAVFGFVMLLFYKSSTKTLFILSLLVLLLPVVVSTVQLSRLETRGVEYPLLSGEIVQRDQLGNNEKRQLSTSWYVLSIIH